MDELLLKINKLKESRRVNVGLSREKRFNLTLNKINLYVSQFQSLFAVLSEYGTTLCQIYVADEFFVSGGYHLKDLSPVRVDSLDGDELNSLIKSTACGFWIANEIELNKDVHIVRVSQFNSGKTRYCILDPKTASFGCDCGMFAHDGIWCRHIWLLYKHGIIAFNIFSHFHPRFIKKKCGEKITKTVSVNSQILFVPNEHTRWNFFTYKFYDWLKGMRTLKNKTDNTVLTKTIIKKASLRNHLCGKPVTFEKYNKIQQDEEDEFNYEDNLQPRDEDMIIHIEEVFQAFKMKNVPFIFTKTEMKKQKKKRRT